MAMSSPQVDMPGKQWGLEFDSGFEESRIAAAAWSLVVIVLNFQYSCLHISAHLPQRSFSFACVFSAQSSEPLGFVFWECWGYPLVDRCQ